ncbi:MAG: hypothetical protein AB7D05_04765 [Mangrovibacterium sp.]
MRALRNLGRLCPLSKTCPVYRGKVKVENTSLLLVRNVFCNRGEKGWNNCKRYQLAHAGKNIPETATPYNQENNDEN